eukprot:5201359-Amphidinium_carterae.3
MPTAVWATRLHCTQRQRDLSAVISEPQLLFCPRINGKKRGTLVKDVHQASHFLRVSRSAVIEVTFTQSSSLPRSTSCTVMPKEKASNFLGSNSVSKSHLHFMTPPRAVAPSFSGAPRELWRHKPPGAFPTHILQLARASGLG